ncbi:ribosome recycling factor, putative [Ricinus communis]|uniref:Ribosome-recycling factor, chloroplastic n=1 Tax=Ricinus communis TaxID=3988 RepID=B9S418_RICCO|nr:ribosome recycling factor, putative [Ricinus communis]
MATQFSSKPSFKTLLSLPACHTVLKIIPTVPVCVSGTRLLATPAPPNFPANRSLSNTWCKRGKRGFVRCATIEEIEAEKSSIEKDAKARMEKTIETVRTNFNSIRTGRANPSMLDKIEVEYYGTPVSLKSIAQISTPDASSLLVQPYDKSSLKSIEKAIVSSDLGLTPNNDGEVIRLSIPQLTSERRKEMSKMVAKLAEEGKVALRNIRRDALKAYEKLEKEKKLSEDNVKDLSGDLQVELESIAQR